MDKSLTRSQYPKVSYARGLIRDAETALGKLSTGERRDLLSDNTTWNRADIEAIVDYIALPLDR
jgi:hypothetical protein